MLDQQYSLNYRFDGINLILNITADLLSVNVSPQHALQNK